jgi:hypothetical protein
MIVQETVTSDSTVNITNAKMLPQYFGKWFSKIERSDMKETDLHFFLSVRCGLTGHQETFSWNAK